MQTLSPIPGYPENPERPSLLSSSLGALLSGAVEGGVKDFTNRRSGRKIEEIMSNQEIPEEDRMMKLLTTPGISPEHQQAVIKQYQFQQQKKLKEQDLSIKLQKHQQQQDFLSQLLNKSPNEAVTNLETPPMVGEEDVSPEFQPEVSPVSQDQAPVVSKQRFSDEQIAGLALINPQLANILQKQKEASNLSEKEFQKEFLKMNLDYGKDLTKKSAESKRLFKGLDTLEDLVNSDATDNKIRNFLGQSENLRWLMEPGSVAFLSGLKDQFSDFKETFGSRPTQYEAKIFEKGLPSLMASKDGKLAAIYMQKAKRQATLAKKKSYDRLNKKVGFKPISGDFISQVENKADKEVDKIYDNLKGKLFKLIEKNKKTSKDNVFLKNEETGDTIEVPKGMVTKYKQYGWSAM